KMSVHSFSYGTSPRSSFPLITVSETGTSYFFHASIAEHMKNDHTSQIFTVRLILMSVTTNHLRGRYSIFHFRQRTFPSRRRILRWFLDRSLRIIFTSYPNANPK